MKQFECFDCENRFDYQDMPEDKPRDFVTGIPLLCPYCDGENVENLYKEE